MKIRIIFILLLISFLNISLVYPQDKTDFSEEFSASKVSGFISYLIDKGDFYRANTELYRLKSYYPKFIDNHTFEVTELYLLYKAEMYDRIIFMNQSGYKKNNDIFSIFIISSLLKKKYFAKASDEFNNNVVRERCSPYRDYFAKRYAFLELVGKSNLLEKEYFKTDNIEGYDEMNILSQSILSKKKSPMVGAFYGLIPGMGYVYAGESGTGFTAMILIGFASFVTALSAREGLVPLSILSGSATAFFYGGSILGGYRETVKYNENLMDRLTFSIGKGLALDKDIDELYVKFGVSNNGK